MIIEDKLSKWITAGLALYRAHPLMIEPVFYDSSQSGFPSAVAPGVVVDLEKHWLPDEYTGGTYRFGVGSFPILGNREQELAIEGDASTVENPQGLPYQIIPPAVQGLTQLLEKKISVSTIFNQVPTDMPMFTIRLQSDAQADTYIGESLCQYAVDGVEFDIRSQALTGSYLISIWAVNREACLWLYAWLQTYALASMPQFATWGLYDISLAGSDLDPALQYLAERTYTRHLLFTATRMERAISTREPIEWVSDVCVKACAQYAQLQGTVSPVMD